MRFDEFEILVARFGTDASRWPEPQLARLSHVARWLEAEREMEREVEAAMGAPAPLSANFADRVVDALPPAPESARVSSPPRGRLAAGAAAGLVAASLAALGTWALWPAREGLAQDWEALAEEAGFVELYAWVEG